MIGLLVLGIGVGFLLYLADRLVKARARARRIQNMSERLAAATARADKQVAEREAVAQASAALTSVVPAIKHPALAHPAEGDAEEHAAD
jgi:hypothetical protein